MKWKLLALILFSSLAFGQTITTQYQFTASSPAAGTTANGGAANETNSGTQFRKITWTVTGTVATCSVRVDSSADNITYTAGGAITAQTCTSNGASTVATGVFNYTRINVTAISGGGSVKVVYQGFPTSPSGGGTVTTVTASAPVTSSGGNTPNIACATCTTNASSLTTNVLPRASGAQTLVDSGVSDDGTIVSSSTVTPRQFDWGTIACSSLNSNILNNAGCAAAYNTFIVNSVGVTTNNLRKALNIYYQGNGQQGNDTFGLQVNGGILQDANTSAVAFTMRGIDVNASVDGSTSANISLYALDLRPRLYNSAHVPRMVYLHGQSGNAIPAGTTVDTLEGITIGASIAGTVTSSHGFGLDRNVFQYGLALGGSIRAGILDDTTAAISGLCHGLYGAASPQTFTEHDCWFGGTGSPESALAANVGAIFARQNGGAGTSLYVKESGTGNTGWQPVVTGGTTALSLATLSLSGQLTSTLATGTAPLVIASTTNVANLNASSLSGATFAAPGPIGSGTPSTGAFTTLTASTGITSYAGITTAGFGIPVQVARVRAVSQAAAIGTTTLLATGGSTADYLVVATLYCDSTSAAATASITISYTDSGSQAQTIAPSAAACTALGSSSFALINSPIVAKNGTNIQYATSIANTPTYDLRIDLYQLGSN